MLGFAFQRLGSRASLAICAAMFAPTEAGREFQDFNTTLSRDDLVHIYRPPGSDCVRLDGPSMHR